MHGERRVVVHGAAGPQSASDVVEVLSGPPRSSRAHAQRLVERPNGVEHLTTQKQREGRNPTPEIEESHRARRRVRPARGRLSSLIHGPPAESVPRGALREEIRHARKQVGWVKAVVVGKSYELARHLLEREVAGSAEARLGAEMDDRENMFEAPKDRSEPVVLVLIDDEQPEVMMRLRIETPQKTGHDVGAPEGREDEIDRSGDYFAPGYNA
jgi:hypothetical protein